MKKNVFLVIMMSFVISCQSMVKKSPITGDVEKTSSLKSSSVRLIASVEDSEKSDFEVLMNFEKQQDRVDAVLQTFQQQKEYDYLAQNQVLQFDQFLDSLIKSNSEKVDLSDDDLDKWDQFRAQNFVGWQFMDERRHSFEDLFISILSEANRDDSSVKESCREILSHSQKWIYEQHVKNEPAAYKIATMLDDVQEEMIFNRKSLSFKLDLKEIVKPKSNQISIDVVKDFKSRFDRVVKPQSGTKGRWEQEIEVGARDLQKAIGESFKLRNQREPQQVSDTLYPSPTGAGQVTGNRFARGKWALTFDDGPHFQYTQQVIDQFRELNTPVTFFWLAQNILKYPQVVQGVQLPNHRALHSYTHAQLSKINSTRLYHEIDEAYDVFTNVVGSSPTLFRCPYGDCAGTGSVVRQRIANLNMLHIFWNVDTLDWQDQNPQSIFERARKQVDLLGRGVILFHDVHPQSVVASKILIEYMKSTGKYQLKGLPELIGESRGQSYESP